MNAPFLQGVSDSQAQGARRSLTVADLARAKHLPASLLCDLGLKDGTDGVHIPYLDMCGMELLVKRRTALLAKEGSFWPKGMPLKAYGQWRLDRAKKVGYLILVEGESDCWVLWYHGLPALGLPGAGAARTLELDFIVDIPKLFVHREPDQGGETFLAGVSQQLARLGYDGKVFELRMPGTVKDPADLHVQNPQAFKQRLEEMLALARPVALKPVAVPVAAAPPVKAKPLTLNELALGVQLSKVTPHEVRWLWPGRIPLGKLTILDGDPGLGKSFVSLDLTARLTRGRPMPFESVSTLEPASVLLLSAEDGIADTIHPRLQTAGADMARVFTLDQLPSEFGGRPVALPEDTVYLAEMLRRTAAKLVVIDPLMAFLADRVNSHNDQNSRRALLPLAKLAESSGAAFVIVRHLNKNTTGNNPLYRGGGSIGIIGAARSGLLLAKDPDDPERRVLAVTKSNLARRPACLTLKIAQVGGDTPGFGIDWVGDSPHTGDSLLQAKDADIEDSSPALAEAQDFLRTALAAAPALVADLLAQARELGIAERTLKRARYRLDIKALFQAAPDGNGGQWSWVLPPAPPSTPSSTT